MRYRYHITDCTFINNRSGMYRLPDYIFDLGFLDFLREKENWRKYFEHIDFWSGKEKEPLPSPRWFEFEEADRRNRE